MIQHNNPPLHIQKQSGGNASSHHPLINQCGFPPENYPPSPPPLSLRLEQGQPFFAPPTTSITATATTRHYYTLPHLLLHHFHHSNIFPSTLELYLLHLIDGIINHILSTPPPPQLPNCVVMSASGRSRRFRKGTGTAPTWS
jgi:hypothetical protein